MQTLSPTHTALREIVAAASSLEERLQGSFIPDEGTENAEAAEARLKRWCQIVAKGDWEVFKLRLEWDNLDSVEVRRMLGTVRLAEDAQLPAWVHTLEEVLRRATSAEHLRQEGARCLVADLPLAFEELLLPFILNARQRLRAQAGDCYDLLNDSAHAELERELLRNLSFCSLKTFHLEFSILRARRTSSLSRLLMDLQQDDSREIYSEFIEQMLADGLLPFFQTYPVLGRILAVITDLWVESQTEFLRRLADDWSLIEQTFASDPLRQVTGIQAGLSDPHKGRRSVLALTFDNGLKLIYKPKQMGIEAAFNQLLQWCNDRELPLAFKVLTVLDRGEYGWSEYVEKLRCKDEEAARRYYQRAGMLLCLVYSLVGADCHHENMIVHGEYPVLIDAEALMQHRARVESINDGAQAQMLAHEMIMESVLHTSMLPGWQIDSDEEQVYDISGLRGPDELIYESKDLRWEYINTDRMTMEERTFTIGPSAEYLAQEGVSLRVEEHITDVITGFEQCYRFLLRQRAALLAPDSPLHGLKQQRLRLIYRNTQVYGTLTYQLLEPQYLHDGADHSIHMESLALAVLPSTDVPLENRQRSRWWPVLASEKQQLQQIDIPFFATSADSAALLLPDGTRIEDCFREPSFELVSARIQSLCEADLELQTSFIAGSLYSLIARDALPDSPVSDVSDREIREEEDRAARKEGFLASALSLAREIEQHAIRATDGSVCWIVPQYMFSFQRYQLQMIASDLYSGSCGVALFLAAVEKVTGGSGYRDLALGALQNLRQALRTYGKELLLKLGIGAAAGLGSIIYSMMYIGQWLDEPALLREARQAVDLITFERIEHDQALDTFAGAAGTLLVLLALYQVAPDPELLQKAIACGQRLLAARTMSPAGYKSWPGFNGKHLTGFSHGAAGITYALLRLYGVTGDSAYLEAASEGIAYEDSTFQSQINNWPDLRSDDPLDYRVAWCHGAPGIGLARVGGLAALDTEQVRADIEIALRRTLDEGVRGLDQLCCGNMGRLDILLAAAHYLRRPELALAAEQATWQIVQRAEKAGRFSLDPLLPRQVKHFGFFQGTAGLGYTLLRMTAPDQLPSILLWD
ncbi:lanthionine synthetase [Dictyobacter sp. S3.2.2.5]|uniref:Lanthionine synthetase n=1 Tax=Dictyobacter halimunensis TaxID=3026934 RepID=A0ABQ6G0M4_9CHLR|nr:lanthionine synthetase [Dictyobacter sp. S3.2.2.5]